MRSLAARAAGFALVCLALGACGGGAGGSAADSVLRVSGTAAKGLMAFAEVTVRTIGPAGPIDPPLLTTSTDAQGGFAFPLPASRRPVLVTVRSVDGTLMQDEGRIVDGDFPWVAAPRGLELRAIIPDPRGVEMTLSVNAFTEAAASAAASATDGSGRSIAWTPAALTAGLQLAELLLPPGVDASSVPAVALSAVANASIPQQWLLVALTGFANTSSACNPGTLAGVRASSPAQCRLDQLRQLARVVVSDDEVLLPTAADLAALRADIYASAELALGASVLAPLAHVAALGEVAVPDHLAKSQDIFDADRAIRNFIGVLRVALRKLPSELDLVQRLVAGRYAGFPVEGVLDVVRKSASMLGECYFYAQVVEPSTDVHCDGDGWAFSGGAYVRLVADPADPSIVTQQTARGEYDPVEGYDVRYTVLRLRQGPNGPPVPVARAELVVRVEGGRPWKGYFVTDKLKLRGAVDAFWGDRPDQQASLGLRALSLDIDPGWATRVSTRGEVTLLLGNTDPSLADALGGEIELSLEPRWIGTRPTLEVTAFRIGLRPRVALLAPTLQPSLQVAGTGVPAASYQDAQSYGVQLDLELGDSARLSVLSSRLAGGPSNGVAVLAFGGDAVQVALADAGPLGPYCLPAGLVPVSCGDAIHLDSRHGLFQAVFHRLGETVDLLRNGSKVGQIDKRGIVEFDLGDGTGVTYSLY